MADQYKIDDLYDIKSAVLLLAERDKKKEDSNRTAEDRIRHYIKNYLEKGDLVLDANNQIELGDLIGWASTKKKFVGKLDGLPVRHTISSEGGKLGLSGTGISDFIPGLPISLDDCHTEIRNLQQRIKFIEQHSSKLEREIEELKPLAEIGINSKKQNKLNASKKRKL